MECSRSGPHFERTSAKSCFESADDIFSEKEKEDADNEKGKLAMCYTTDYE